MQNPELKNNCVVICNASPKKKKTEFSPAREQNTLLTHHNLKKSNRDDNKEHLDYELYCSVYAREKRNDWERAWEWVALAIAGQTIYYPASQSTLPPK
jgi:hypothetical protein